MNFKKAKEGRWLLSQFEGAVVFAKMTFSNSDIFSVLEHKASSPMIVTTSTARCAS